jgi:hypothetical protein
LIELFDQFKKLILVDFFQNIILLLLNITVINFNNTYKVINFFSNIIKQNNLFTYYVAFNTLITLILYKYDAEKAYLRYIYTVNTKKIPLKCNIHKFKRSYCVKKKIIYDF